MEISVRVENVSKKYVLGERQQNSLREKLTQLFSFKKTEEKKAFWALNNINFDIHSGEIIGIIGKNGAGKSTLLKILSRITHPTTGQIEIFGKVAALLEVGTGFHPELTGRENIYLNGTLLGMSRHEVEANMHEIIAFSGVEKFMDTPVKFYSSGMYVRLAFSVAAHLNPDTLIVDEVLAVGDSEFQKKCLGKMGEVAKSGKTVIFVSHNMQAISALTQKCILLEAGQIKFFGDTTEAIHHYLAQSEISYRAEDSDRLNYVSSVRLVTSEPGQVQAIKKPFEVQIDICTQEVLIGAAVSFQILDYNGVPITHILNLDDELPFGRTPGIHALIAKMNSIRLYPGHYTLNVYFAERSTQRHFDTLESICPFEVVVLNEMRDYYWIPNHGRYIEDVIWSVS